MRLPGVIGSVLAGLGVLAVFVGQQILTPGAGRTGALALGAVAVVAALAVRLLERRRLRGAARRVESALLAATAGVAVALLLYGLSLESSLAALGREGDAAETLRGVLWALWPAVLGVSATSLLFMELAYRGMPVEEAVEVRRVAGAGIGGASLALALVFLASINYVASARDVVRDLSYFRTSAPSAATLQMVERLGERVEVVLFYPEVNEVRDQLVPYFRALDRASEKLAVDVQDHALSPTLARDHRIRGNGYVLLLRGEGETRQAESFEVGTDLEAARSRLRTLDGTFQRSFAKLTRQRREIALTTGHGERNDRSAMRLEGESVDRLEEALERANVTMKDLGIAQGLAGGVPAGTPAVMALGPREPFLPEEASALVDYLKRGGRVALFVDPGVEHGLDPVLAALGLSVQPGTVASDTQFVARTRTAADRGIVYSSRYSSHPTVTLASRNAQQLVTVLLSGGGLEERQGGGRLDGVTVSFPIRTPAQTWRDLDGDFERDGETEPLEALNLMAVVTVPNPDGEEGRAVVIADAEFATDQLMRIPFANGFVVGDILNWFLGEEQIIGDTTSEEDVRVELRREEDALLFYGTSFGAPLPILGLGAWVALRRRRSAPARAGARAPNPTEETPR